MKAFPICWGDGPPPTPGGERGEGLGDGSPDMILAFGATGGDGGEQTHQQEVQTTTHPFTGSLGGGGADSPAGGANYTHRSLGH